MQNVLLEDQGCIPNAVLRTSANSHGWFLQVCQCTIQVDEERKVTRSGLTQNLEPGRDEGPFPSSGAVIGL